MSGWFGRKQLAMACLAACLQVGAVRAEVGPGPASVDGATGADLFTEICLDTLPEFRKAAAVVQALPFRQHPDTGTWYHRDLDLSVKLFTDGGHTYCSMVFSSRDAAGELAMFFGFTAALASDNPQLGVDPDADTAMVQLPRGAVFEFTPGASAGGKQYYRARIVARD